MKKDKRTQELVNLIAHHKTLKNKAKETPVKELTENGFIDTYDKRTVDIEDNKIKQYTYELEKIKAENLWIPRKTKSLDLAWSNFLSSTNKELEYIKSQRTKRYFDDKTNMPIWKPDQIAIAKLKKYIEDKTYEYDTWLDKNTCTNIQLIKLLVNEKIIRFLLALIFGVFFFIGIPYLVNHVVTSKTPFNIVIAENSDWIGFWGTYIAGTFGAIIGGFIAYLISSHQFKKQDNMRKEDRLIAMVIDNIPTITKDLNQLSYLINLDKSYCQTLITLDMEYANKKYDQYFSDETMKFLNRIKENKYNLFSLLEQLTNKVNSNRIIINHIIEYYRSLNTEILELIASTKTIEDYYLSLVDTLSSEKNIGNQSAEIYKTFDSMKNKYARVSYEIYSIETDLQNDLSFIMHGAKVLKKQTLEEYFEVLSI